MPKKKSDSRANDKLNKSSSSVFDVSKPGSSPAGPTSRPILAGHQSAISQDPLLTKEETEANQPGNNLASTPRLTKQKNLSPLAPEPDKASAAEESASDVQDEDDAGEPAKTSDSSPAIDVLAGEVDAKAQARQQSKADKDNDERLQALIDAKRYHLPITEGGKKAASERMATWLLVFMLVAAAAAWLAIDAGYLDIGLDLPYDFIKN